MNDYYAAATVNQQTTCCTIYSHTTCKQTQQ